MSTPAPVKLRERHKLAHDWLPDGCPNVLDGGCAFGSGTVALLDKARKVFGCDPNHDLIARARQLYPQVLFEVCPLEKMPYPDASFEAITMTDVFEHVADERQTLNELYRVLKPGGALIITTPHKGMFSFMDTENYIWFLRTKLSGLHRLMFRLKHGRFPEQKVGYTERHRHYRLRDFQNLFDQSAFKGHYRIERAFRSGLFCYPITSNLFEALSVVVGLRLATKITTPLAKLSDWDYFISYGPLAYNIAILVRKI